MARPGACSPAQPGCSQAARSLQRPRPGPPDPWASTEHGPRQAGQRVTHSTANKTPPGPTEGAPWGAPSYSPRDP